MSTNNSGSKRHIGNYVLEQTIGEGMFGKVYLGIHSHTSEQVAIKIVDMNKVSGEWSKTRVAREIKIMKRIRHPHVIQMYEVMEREQQTIMVMEYAPHGELYNYIVDHGRVDEEHAVFFFRQIICGVETLHQERVAHRDLKPENLLLDKFDNVKIADFGLSNVYDKENLMKTACGSPCYAPPEMIDGKQYVPSASDIWSCGVVLFALVCGYLPFEEETTPQVYVKIKEGDFDIPFFVSPAGKDLMLRILEVDPAKRATFEEIKNHRWYCGYTGPMFSTPVSPLDASGGCNVPTCLSCKQQRDAIDETIVGQLVLMGISRSLIVDSISMRLPNHISTIYFLLHAKKLRQDGLSGPTSAYPQQAWDGNMVYEPPTIPQVAKVNLGYVPRIIPEPAVKQDPRRKLAYVPPVIPEFVTQAPKQNFAYTPPIIPRQAAATKTLRSPQGLNVSPAFVPSVKLSPPYTTRPGVSPTTAPRCIISLASNHPTPKTTPRLGDNTWKFVSNKPTTIISPAPGTSIGHTTPTRSSSPRPCVVQGSRPRPCTASVRPMGNANPPRFQSVRDVFVGVSDRYMPPRGEPVAQQKPEATNGVCRWSAQPSLLSVTPLSTPLITPRLLTVHPPLLAPLGTHTPTVATTPSITPRSIATTVPPPPRHMNPPRGTILGGLPLPCLEWPVATSQQPTPKAVYRVTYPCRVKPGRTIHITRPPASVLLNPTARPSFVSRAPNITAARVADSSAVARTHMQPGADSLPSKSLHSEGLLISLEGATSLGLAPATLISASVTSEIESQISAPSFQDCQPPITKSVDQDVVLGNDDDASGPSDRARAEKGPLIVTEQLENHTQEAPLQLNTATPAATPPSPITQILKIQPQCMTSMGRVEKITLGTPQQGQNHAREPLRFHGLQHPPTSFYNPFGSMSAHQYVDNFQGMHSPVVMTLQIKKVLDEFGIKFARLSNFAFQCSPRLGQVKIEAIPRDTASHIKVSLVKGDVSMFAIFSRWLKSQLDVAR
eukprot:GEMP01003107.1.p1 GENE.GEMP01003107.1~~GEMP01003107.1.p1  ORF type:complete len:1003 (+),score=189.00 GEMP01003107.1:58-3066(+)